VSDTCPCCGHLCPPGARCGIDDPKRGSLFHDEPLPRHPQCPYGLVDGRIGIMGRELSGRPVLVLPGDPRAPE
jgi:hypothetical protein